MQLKKLIVPLALAAALSLGACSSTVGKKSSTAKEQSTQKHGYDKLVAEQPAHSMDYSPTRDTINGWIDTWNKRGQLAFIYLLNANGNKVGYFIFQGPPVTYCAALTPTWKFTDPGGWGDRSYQQVKAPSIDGVYYSGGQCTEYIGKDATTGQILDFTAGNGLNFVSSTQPLYLNDPTVTPLGPSKVSDLTKTADGKYVAK